MGWVKNAIKALNTSGECQVRPYGGSMRGRIESGQLVTICTVIPTELAVNDVVFVRWKGNYLLHLIKDIEDDQVLIGNNLGKINGWIPIADVIGKVQE